MRISPNKSVSNDDEPLSPTSRLMHAPNFNIFIIIVMGYTTKIDPNLYKTCMQQTILKHPRFSSILITKNGKSYWKRSGKPNIDNHVFVPDVDPDMESPDEFVADFASNLSEIPMDMTKPLWELYILNVKTSDANSVVVMRVHHSIGDGVSIVALSHACSRKLDDPNSLPTFPSPKKERKRGSNRWWVTRMFVLIWTAVLIIFYTLIDIATLVGTVFLVRDSQTPIKIERGERPSRKKFVHRIVNFGDVKLVKTAMNVSVNDVVLGATVAGLSRYLNRYEMKNKENGSVKKRTDFLPRNLAVRSTVMYNLRPSPKLEDLSEMMEKEELNGKWGNLIGIILLPFTIAVQDDPLTYVYRAKSTMDRKKLSLAPKIGFLVRKLTVSLFGIKAAARVTGAVFSNTTLTFSNVMGPKEEISLFGHHLSYVAPSAPGFPQSLIIHYQSYADKLVISIGADEKLIPDPHQLCDDLVKSLQDIKEAVIKRGLV